MRATSLLLLTALACTKAEETTPAVDPPRLTVDTPSGGSWVAPGTMRVSGFADGLTDVTIDGEAVSLDGKRFEGAVQVAQGISAFEVSGTDANGDTVFERRSVIAGTFGPAGQRMDNVAVVQLTPEGLDQILGIVPSLLDVDALVAQLQAANPVTSGGFTGFSYNVNLDSLTLAPPAITLELRDGVIGVTVVVDDFATAVTVYGDALLIPYDTTAGASVDRTTITFDLALAAGGGGVQASVGPVLLDLQGFHFDASLIPGSIEDQIPILSDAIRDFVVLTLQEQVAAVAPDLVHTFADALDLSFQTELLGRELSVEAGIASLKVDETGIRAGLDLGVRVRGAGDEPRYAGMFTLPKAPHHLPTDASIGVSLHDNLLNAILFEVWRSGLLELTLSSEDEPLMGVLLQQLGAPAGSISVSAHLPPVAIEADGGLELQVGELDLRIDTPGGTYGDTVTLRLAGKIPLAPRIEGGALGVELGTPELSLMVVETDWRASYSTITNLLEDQLPISSLMAIAGAFSFPLPSFAGISVSEAIAIRAPSGVHTEIALDLAVGAAP
ncbi:MAG TPA: hypothetical protein PKA64_06200 [Myxococcota bacterium]|nr:hypothetical protein [Myxococcota bacterium]